MTPPPPHPSPLKGEGVKPLQVAGLLFQGATTFRAEINGFLKRAGFYLNNIMLK
jgi:hypothetical protein